MIKAILVSIIVLMSVCPNMPKAQELSLLGGGTNANGIGGVTETWGFSYLQPIADEGAISFTWQNEGPLRDNHRDGLSLQYWKRMQLPKSKVGLGVGLGPYVFFNTTGGGYRDQHGIGMMLSITSTKYFSNGLFCQLRINQIIANNSFNSTAIMAGIGYDFGEVASFPAIDQGAGNDMNYDGEITVFAGRSVINNIGKPGDLSYSFEYRYLFDKYADLTMSFINEGHTTPSTRAGVALQEAGCGAIYGIEN